jgi:hypothetical protein
MDGPPVCHVVPVVKMLLIRLRKPSEALFPSLTIKQIVERLRRKTIHALVAYEYQRHSCAAKSPKLRKIISGRLDIVLGICNRMALEILARPMAVGTPSRAKHDHWKLDLRAVPFHGFPVAQIFPSDRIAAK